MISKALIQVRFLNFNKHEQSFHKFIIIDKETAIKEYNANCLFMFSFGIGESKTFVEVVLKDIS